jgi:non-specific serine/threonine protein kinase
MSAIWWLWFTAGFLNEARGYVESLLTCDPTGSVRAKALNAPACLMIYQGLGATAHPPLEEALALYRASNDRKGIAEVTNNLGSAVGFTEDLPRGRALLEECIRLSREGGDAHRHVRGMINLADLVLRDGDIALARSLAEEGLELSKTLGNCVLRTIAFQQLGDIAAREERHTLALFCYRDALQTEVEVYRRWTFAETLERLAETYAAIGQPSKGARLTGAAAALWEAVGSAGSIYLFDRRERTIAGLRSTLGEKVFQAALAEGGAMPLERVIEYALADEE